MSAKARDLCTKLCTQLRGVLPVGTKGPFRACYMAYAGQKSRLQPFVRWSSAKVKCEELNSSTTTYHTEVALFLLGPELTDETAWI